jgi:phosphatidate cytidylyltransferase
LRKRPDQIPGKETAGPTEPPTHSMRPKIRERSNLEQRIIAGLIGGAIFVGAIFWNEWSYFAVFLALTLLGMIEFYRLLGIRGFEPNQKIGLVMGGGLFVIVFLIQKELLPLRILFLMPALMALVFVIELYRKKALPFVNISVTLLGVLYVAAPFSLLTLLGFLGDQYSWHVIMGCLLLIWASDTGAYFIGKNFGRHKLMERISPSKTWEGWAGGVLFSLLVAWGLAGFFTDLDLLRWIIIGLIVSVFGVLGDLVESMLKRGLEVKDSGTLIPGHGGILDRFDSLLMVVPFVVAFLKVFWG